MSDKENVTIDSITYVVEMENSPESNRARGRDNLARAQEENGIARTLYIRRPKGRVLHMAHQYESGHYSYAVRIGR